MLNERFNPRTHFQRMHFMAQRTSPLNMTSGPVEVSEAVLEAQLYPFLTPHHPDFWSLQDETLAMLGRIMATQGRVLAFHGSIRTGLDIALANLVAPGTPVLSISNGFWGDLIGTYAESYGARVHWVRENPLVPIGREKVAQALAAHPEVELVTIVHVETNTGLANPVNEIGALVQNHGALYYVDTACSAGGMPLETDAWHIDVGVTGSHKCLCSVPGLAVVSVSEQAWERAAEVSQAGNYFDFHSLHAMTVERLEVPPFTQPSGIIRALHAALSELEGIGREAWFERHRRAGARFRDTVRACGLSMLPEQDAGHNIQGALSDTVMAVRLPDEVDLETFRRVLVEEFGIYVLGNLGEFANCSFRVGLMSPPQLAEENLAATLQAIPAALEQAAS